MRDRVYEYELGRMTQSLGNVDEVAESTVAERRKRSKRGKRVSQVGQGVSTHQGARGEKRVPERRIENPNQKGLEVVLHWGKNSTQSIRLVEVNGGRGQEKKGLAASALRTKRSTGGETSCVEDTRNLRGLLVRPILGRGNGESRAGGDVGRKLKIGGQRSQVELHPKKKKKTIQWQKTVEAFFDRRRRQPGGGTFGVGKKKMLGRGKHQRKRDRRCRGAGGSREKNY